MPSRRTFLGGSLGAAGLAAAGGAGFGLARAEAGPGRSGASEAVPFYGEHQAGIATPAQDRLAFGAFDVTTADRSALQSLLATWSAAAARMTAGEPVGPVETLPEAPPADTGEATGLPASRLTITVGFGPSLFDERFGLARFRPAALTRLPSMPGDYLQADISDGDLCVQACADDPQVAFHAVRNLARLARGTAVLRWSQLGFGRTSSTSRSQETPRNLMGFKDGTNNLKNEDAGAFDTFVWVGDRTDQPWMRGGSYLVSRRIRMLIENWDTDFLGDQEAIFGRRKDTGAPLGAHQEFDPVDLAATNSDGTPLISLDSHIRLASPVTNHGVRFLRRGYSYTDGIDQDTGLLDAGLFFIVFCQDAHAQFVPVQSRLGQHDSLNEYIRHTSSALFAVPPGLGGPGDYYGRAFFA